jgi:hypothetical protein
MKHAPLYEFEHVITSSCNVPIKQTSSIFETVSTFDTLA